MQANEHLVLCGGEEEPQVASGQSLRLDLHGRSPNVRLQISDISRRLLANVPYVLADLLEIASYVYAADSAISRGERPIRKWEGGGVENSGLRFRFACPASGLPIPSCPRSSRRWASFPMTATSSSSGRSSMRRPWRNT